MVARLCECLVKLNVIDCVCLGQGGPRPIYPPQQQPGYYGNQQGYPPGGVPQYGQESGFPPAQGQQPPAQSHQDSEAMQQ